MYVYFLGLKLRGKFGKTVFSVIQKVRWKANKNEQGEGGPSMCVRSLFKTKILRFSK